MNLAVDNEATPAIYPIVNNQFIAGATTYTVNVPVAYSNAAGRTVLANGQRPASSFRTQILFPASPTR